MFLDKVVVFSVLFNIFFCDYQWLLSIILAILFFLESSDQQRPFFNRCHLCFHSNLIYFNSRNIFRAPFYRAPINGYFRLSEQLSITYRQLYIWPFAWMLIFRAPINGYFRLSAQLSITYCQLYIWPFAWMLIFPYHMCRL